MGLWHYKHAHGSKPKKKTHTQDAEALWWNQKNRKKSKNPVQQLGNERHKITHTRARVCKNLPFQDAVALAASRQPSVISPWADQPLAHSDSQETKRPFSTTKKNQPTDGNETFLCVCVCVLLFKYLSPVTWPANNGDGELNNKAIRHSSNRGKRKERNATRPRCQGWQSANRKCLPRATFLALWGGVPFFSFIPLRADVVLVSVCVCVLARLRF